MDLPQHDMGQVPYMIYIHGGGWQHGDLNVFKKHSIYMTERGIAGVRISYPLINQGGSLKRVMELIEKSVSFIRKHEKDWKLDSSRFGFVALQPVLIWQHWQQWKPMDVGFCRYGGNL